MCPALQRSRQVLYIGIVQTFVAVLLTYLLIGTFHAAAIPIGLFGGLLAAMVASMMAVWDVIGLRFFLGVGWYGLTIVAISGASLTVLVLLGLLRGESGTLTFWSAIQSIVRSGGIFAFCFAGVSFVRGDPHILVCIKGFKNVWRRLSFS